MKHLQKIGLAALLFAETALVYMGNDMRKEKIYDRKGKEVVMTRERINEPVSPGNILYYGGMAAFGLTAAGGIYKLVKKKQGEKE